ncbi:signal transduction histidine kinase [Catalinimonas alkaloidigena]|uniref:ATP-binding protein n=1 Tax=Catalinimonas alkaloidigena TaxID=1075417 RepID=UPI0024057720|nr:ATP-binding protein [Catalinimonas alkaloidigena]MDF9795247.1 signal transduction histidine kinase [Catalinimonas alkaloidigena]
MKMDLLSALREIPNFEGIEDQHLQWLADKGELIFLSPGDYLFKKGEPAEHMYIMLEGIIQLKIPQGSQLRDVSLLEKGDITGILPYSRMKEAGGYGVATTKTTIFSLHKTHFQEMETESHAMVQALVSVMTSRTRDYTRRQQQNDKMMALGKLSAGLAHELNNPASAIIRCSAALKSHLHNTPESFKQIISVRLTPDQVDEVNDILFAKINQHEFPELSMLERNNQEDEIAEWLEDQGFEDAYDIAETFVSFGLTIADVEEVGEITKGEYLPQVLGWIQNVLNTERLVAEIEQASSRISALVQSVKTYSHMDRAQDKEFVNLHTGIDSTLTMLSHKLKQKNIEVIKKYEDDLPRVKAFVSELNQVWTNIIDNAIDAMEQKGRLTIRSRSIGERTEVTIQDNGSGIPPDLLSHIFDPFFTTKSIGQGTGLGLDIVKKILDQHQADIDVKSKPGATVFKVSFPVS